MGPDTCAAVRHSEGKEAPAQEEDLGAMAATWDSVRVKAEEVGSGVGKARAVVMSSASAGFTKCEKNMALCSVLEM